MSINTFFWFENSAEEAATLYAGLIPNSRITDVARDSEGVAFVVSVELDGQSVTLMNGGPGHPLTDAASLQVVVETQEEIDRLWDALTEGGAPGPCGWLTDRFGLSWQIAPAVLPTLMSGDNAAKTIAVGTALRSMSKLDIKTLQDAYDNA